MSQLVRWCKVTLDPQKCVLQNISRPLAARSNPRTPFCYSFSALLLDSESSERQKGSDSRELGGRASGECFHGCLSEEKLCYN